MLVRKLELETITEKTNQINIEDDWLVYGHSDLLRTSILTDNNQCESCNDELNKIYKDSMDLNGELKQVFYLLYGNDDKEFIENAKKNNFMSIYYITLCYDRSKIGFETIMNNFVNLSGEKIRVYETLDNYDLIVISYNSSISEIELQFSDYLNKSLNTFFEENQYKVYVRDIYKMYTTAYSKINSNDVIDKIENIKIQFSIKNNFKILDFMKELNKQINNDKVSIKNISGSKDIYVNIKDISTKQLFALYKTNQNQVGVFALNSTFKNNYISSSNLKFMTNVNNKIYEYYSREIPKIYDNFKKMVENVDLKDKKIRSLYIVDLKRVLNAMMNVLKLSLPDYSFLSLYLGMKKFLQKIGELNNDNYLNYPTRLFLESSFSIINTSSAIQIGYYPKQEYVSKEVIAPSELMSFYSAFLWKMASTIIKIEKLSGSTTNPIFTFCLTPSIRENVVIKGLFMKDNKINDRLLLVDIPIKNVYKPDIMIFSLCHEASHYSGELVRQRKQRMNYIYKAYTLYLLDRILNGIDSTLLKKYPIDEDIKKTFSEYVTIISKRYKLAYYSVNVNKILQEATFNLLSDLLFSVRRMFNYYIDKNNIIEESEVLLNVIKTVKKNSTNVLINIDYKDKIECILEMFSESYADLFAILYLNIDKKSYEECITKAEGVDKISEITSDYILIRVLANYYANDFDVSQLVGRIGYQNSIYQKHISLPENETEKVLSTVFENSGMLKYLIDYLKECKKNYQSIYDNNDIAEIKKLMKEKSDIKDLLNRQLDMRTIYKYNQEFRKYIMEDIKKNTESNND